MKTATLDQKIGFNSKSVLDRYIMRGAPEKSEEWDRFFDRHSDSMTLFQTVAYCTGDIGDKVKQLFRKGSSQIAEELIESYEFITDRIGNLSELFGELMLMVVKDKSVARSFVDACSKPTNQYGVRCRFRQDAEGHFQRPENKEIVGLVAGEFFEAHYRNEEGRNSKHWLKSGANILLMSRNYESLRSQEQFTDPAIRKSLQVL
jgi:hypothetical protein